MDMYEIGIGIGGPLVGANDNLHGGVRVMIAASQMGTLFTLV